MNRPLENPALAAAAPRLVLVDVFRFICAAWVMWFHIPQSDVLRSTAEATRFRLPFFVVLAVFFQLTHMERKLQEPFGQYAWKRIRRVYLPFLAWMFLYVLARTLGRLAHEPLTLTAFREDLRMMHLWFLPFLVEVALLTYPFAKGILRRVRFWPLHVAAGVALGVAASLLAAWISTRFGWEVNAPGNYRRIALIPCIPLGFAAYFLHAGLRRNAPAKSWLFAAALLGFAACIAADVWLYRGPLVQNLAGLTLVIISLRPATGGLWLVLASWGRYSFGMYAIHLFFVEAMQNLRQSVFHIPPTWWYDILTLVVCVVLSLLGTMLLYRFRATRWLVPTGEKPTTPPDLPAKIPVLQTA